MKQNGYHQCTITIAKTHIVGFVNYHSYRCFFFFQHLAVGILVAGFVFEVADFKRPWEGCNDKLERYITLYSFFL